MFKQEREALVYLSLLLFSMLVWGVVVAGLAVSMAPKPTTTVRPLVTTVDVCAQEHPPVPCKGAFQ